MAHRVVLDVDPGIDDSLAILLALASPEIELAAIGVTGGNCTLADGVRNALGVLELVNRTDIDVCAGVALPLIRPPFTAPETHGDNGLGYARLDQVKTSPSNEHAVDRIIREIMSAPGEVTLVAVAPLTNVAMAIRKEPRIVQAVKQLIIMGGAVQVEGNTTSLAEFNFFVDPHAAHIVLHSGMPMTLVPWDITRDVILYESDLAPLKATNTALGNFVSELTRFYMEFHLACFGYAGCSVNDPAALVLAFAPDLAQTEPRYVDIEINSELTIGKTVIGYIGDMNTPPSHSDMLGFDDSTWPAHWKPLTRRKPNVQLVTSFDTKRFNALLVERLVRLAQA